MAHRRADCWRRCVTAYSRVTSGCAAAETRSLVIEDLWLLVQRLRGVGAARDSRQLDARSQRPSSRSPHDPGAFDGEALRPVQRGARCAAAQLQGGQLSLRRRPGGEAGARICAARHWPAMVVPTTVRGVDGPCNDWRARLGGDFADPMRPTFRGAFPLSCGDKVWHVSDGEPRSTQRRYFAGSGSRAAASGADKYARAPLRPTPGGWRSTSRTAGRSHPRHQQVQQQRDGTAAVPDARNRIGAPAGKHASARNAQSATGWSARGWIDANSCLKTAPGCRALNASLLRAWPACCRAPSPRR